MSKASSGNDSLYGVDDAKLDKIRQQKAWMSDPKFFRRVKLSPSATVKMMVHGQSGVEKGIKQSGKPVEVMGMLIGRPDTDDPNCLIISDAQPLPIEGFETRVIADDISVNNYMIELGEVNEMTRKERFCGWYHTHPFDIDVNSHCYLSNTDISTQLQWQRAEDPHGHPWVAIVIDPLRSLAKGHPEMKAFRVYPPDYNPPLNETPDGMYVSDDRTRVEKWGVCWNRYYELGVSYYMSQLAQTTLGILKNNFLWQSSLTSTPTLEPEHQQRLAERVGTVAEKLHLHGAKFHRSGGSSGPEGNESVTGGGGGPGGRGSDGSGSGVCKAAQGATEIASEECQCSVGQLTKRVLFGAPDC